MFKKIANNVTIETSHMDLPVSSYSIYWYHVLDKEDQRRSTCKYKIGTLPDFS